MQKATTFAGIFADLAAGKPLTFSDMQKRVVEVDRAFFDMLCEETYGRDFAVFNKRLCQELAMHQPQRPNPDEDWKKKVKDRNEAVVCGTRKAVRRSSSPKSPRYNRRYREKENDRATSAISDGTKDEGPTAAEIAARPFSKALEQSLGTSNLLSEEFNENQLL